MNEAPRQDFSSNLERPDHEVEFAKEYLNTHPDLVEKIRKATSAGEVQDLLVQELVAEGDTAPLMRKRNTTLLAKAIDKWREK